MGKIIISEQRLNALINECLEEVMLEEGFRDTIGKAWNGIKSGVKKGAQAVGSGLRDFAEDPVGTAARVKGWYDQTKNRIKNNWNDNYNLARDRVRAQSVNDNAWDKLDPGERDAIVQVNGRDEFGNWKFRTIRYAKTLGRSIKDPNQIAQIMTEKGFKGITPEYVQKMLDMGKGNQEQQQNTGELSPNPDVATAQTTQNNTQGIQNKAQGLINKYATFLKQKGFQLVNGQWLYTKDGSNSPATQSQYPDIVKAANAYNVAMRGANKMYESKIRKMVEESLKKYLNEELEEVGDTWKGQEMLGRLSARRFKQSGAERRKADMSLDPSEEEQHKKKASDYMKRSTSAYVKARDERDKKHDSWTKPAQMMANAYKSGEKKGERERLK